MHYVFAILIIALLVRETVPLGDIYVLRGITEGLALAIGSWWILSHSHSITYRKYTLLGLYALSLMPTIILSLEPLHVALQILSLLAIVIFFVAYVESNLGTSPTQQTTILIILCALTLVCTGSLMLFQISPSLAYDQTLEYYGWNSTPRFKGLFGKPAT